MEEHSLKNRELAERKIAQANGFLGEWDGQRAIKSWADFQNFIDQIDTRSSSDGKRPGWAYRGEGQWNKPLESSLEKEANRSKISLDKLYESRIEQGMIRRFKREYPRMSSSLPPDNDHMGWLSIMQHHGSPTRLLDITYSIYVALYFSLWNYSPNDIAALWCFNIDWLHAGWNENPPRGYAKEFDSDLEGRYLKLFNIVLHHRKPKVYVVNPYVFPERLVLQQSGFLLPLDVTKPFMDNLASMPLDPRGMTPNKNGNHRVLKLQLMFTERALDEVRYRLLRMNINNATLFPGLDGFARSLKDRLPFEEQRAGIKKGF
jgi:hypothetical protein